MLKPVRRLIAAHNAEGQSYIQEDRDAPNVTNTGGIDGYPWTELWAVDSVPADNSGNFDANWSIRLDTLTAVMLIVVTTVSACVHVYSVGYMNQDKSKPF